MHSPKIVILEIPEGNGLDPITVYWRNFEPGRGQATIICYGMPWHVYFGAMTGQTIQEFFENADVDYLVCKLLDRQWHKRTRAHEKYLARIVGAIKASLNAQTHSEAA